MTFDHLHQNLLRLWSFDGDMTSWPVWDTFEFWVNIEPKWPQMALYGRNWHQNDQKWFKCLKTWFIMCVHGLFDLWKVTVLLFFQWGGQHMPKIHQNLKFLVLLTPQTAQFPNAFTQIQCWKWIGKHVWGVKKLTCFHSAHPTGWAESISGNGVVMYVCM